MGMDPIRPSELTSPDVTQVRVERPRQPVSDYSNAAAPIMKPVAPQPDTSIQVQWDADSGVVVQITDKSSGQLVRQIPSEQVLNVARFIDQLLQEERIAASSAAKTSSERNHV
jgi:uncharacterized FlaG/YvyC family protein